MSPTLSTLTPSMALVHHPRRTLPGIALLVLLSLPALGMAETAAGTGFVFTADERGNTVSRVDLSAGTVIEVAVGVAPHNIQIGADGRRLLVVGAPADAAHGEGHGHAGGSGRLLIMDPLALEEAATEIEVGDHPAHVVTDQEGRRAFVTNAGDDTLSVVDLEAGVVVATVPTGDYPHGLRLSPNGQHLLVANVQDGTVSLIDAHTLGEVGRIAVGSAPVQVAFLPDGSRAYVSLRDDDAVAVIDMASLKVIDRIPVGDGPIQLYVTPDGAKIFVANQGTDSKLSNEVSVIAVTSGSAIDTVTVGMGAHGVAISTDGTMAFVTNSNDGSMSTIDTETHQVLATHAVGFGPNGVTYLKQ